MSFPVPATSPLPYALVLLVVLVVAWRWLPGGVRYAGVIVEILLVVLMTPLGANTLARMVESRAPPASACKAPMPDTVVVLGAGFAYPPASPDDFGALHLAGLQRVFAGVALWRRIPGARLVIAGGGGSGRIREAVPMANLAMQLGVPAASVEIEDRSRNTWQNARNVAALTPPVPKRIWLVTSAMHLPRALGAFRAWGFEPCAWPSNLPEARLKIWPWAFVPQGSAVSTASVALHELIGEAEYAWLEWRHARHATAEARH
ncbi:MAG: YdcF family protein [Rhodanobacteraceae bacterium]